jgi:CubicO group peptidase (beta-lactamase class C family)
MKSPNLAPRRLLTWSLLASLVSLFGRVSAAPPADTQAALDNWLAGLPGGVAAAWIDADGVVFFNAGRYSAKDVRPITPDTQFEIGSITKGFTGLLLADAVRVGKVKLNAPVGAPFAPSKVTYLQLATHTSGLPEMPPNFAASDSANPYAEQDLPTLVKAFDAVAPKVKPRNPHYSNFGFAVLGQAVAGAWGRSYAALLTERVLAPLGLRDTVVDWHDADPKRIAPSHSEAGPTVNWDENAYAPGGALVSTARDLARYLQACVGLIDNPLKDVLADAVQPRAVTPNAARWFGLGWQVEKRGAAMIVWHSGATGGYRGFVGYDAAKRVGVVLLTNHLREVEPVGFALLAGSAPTTPPAARPADSMKELLGNYPLAPASIITITAEGEQLFASMPYQPRWELKRLAVDRYDVVGSGKAEISFERDTTGKVVALVQHWNGTDQRAPHLAPGELPVPPKEIVLPADTLKSYAGRYQLGAKIITVTADDAKLWLQLTGQGPSPVFASAKDELFYKVVNAQISFVRDGADQVVALVLHQNGRDQRAERAP